MLTFLGIIVANISEIIFQDCGKLGLTTRLKTLLQLFKSIRWHILSSRETPYVIVYTLAIYLSMGVEHMIEHILETKNMKPSLCQDKKTKNKSPSVF